MLVKYAQKMKETIEVINGLKKAGLILDYAIGGAVGVLRWVEPFFTRDLDVFIVLPQQDSEKGLISLSSLYEYLRQKGYSEWKGQWIIIAGTPVEFLPAEGLSREAVNGAVEVEYEGIKTKVMTPEYLIALLAKAGRDKDIIKIKMLMDEAGVDIERLNKILTSHDLVDKFRQWTKIR